VVVQIKNSKKAHEFLGLCLGILADDKLVKKEVEFLRNWLRENPKVAGTYPIKGLFLRLCEMLEDETIDDVEEKELFKHLFEMTGNSSSEEVLTLPDVPGYLEFTEPVPEMSFQGAKVFLFGQFIIGTTDRLAELIVEKGGIFCEELNEETNYCIIGTMSELDGISREDAMRINQLSLVGLKVVAEENWVNFIF
jgi:hypothetical protein